MNRQYLKIIGLTDEQAAEVQHLFDLERLKVRALAEALARCRFCRRRARRHPPTSPRGQRGKRNAGKGRPIYTRRGFREKEPPEKPGHEATPQTLHESR